MSRALNFAMRAKLSVSIIVALATTACGGLPLESIGLRSSDWINEPTVPTTVGPPPTTPIVVSAEDLRWANDEIVTESLEDPAGLLAEVFARRQGDRFVQASRFEIAIALPDVAFPQQAPPGAEWVSSQLVFDNDGSLADDPSAAFGIWSAEPYSRSRSVAQMAVLRVSNDPETANELASGAAPSCALFAERTTEECEIIAVGTRATWLLTATSGSTLIWFDGPYRYELFGRSFVSLTALKDMSEVTVPLQSIAPTGS
jgi:hypothetical protein